MSDQVALTADAPRCVWMSAGLLTYKLCDRGFDCEHCPLDAALRGDPILGGPRLALSEPGLRTRIFPEDRRYSEGHLWVQARGRSPAENARLGLDSFAGALIARAAAVRCPRAGLVLQPGQVACEIDLGLGVLPLGTPVSGRVEGGNQILEQQPQRVITSPYGEGWILEMVLGDPVQLQSLLSAEEARQRARLDLRRFRRRLALYLLADASTGPSLADGGELLTDLRQMLGGQRYLELLRLLIH